MTPLKQLTDQHDSLYQVEKLTGVSRVTLARKIACNAHVDENGFIWTRSEHNVQKARRGR